MYKSQFDKIRGHLTMTKDGMMTFVDNLGRCEFFDEINDVMKTNNIVFHKAVLDSNYLKGVMVTLVELGYDIYWVYGEFKDAFEDVYFRKVEQVGPYLSEEEGKELFKFYGKPIPAPEKYSSAEEALEKYREFNPEYKLGTISTSALLKKMENLKEKEKCQKDNPDYLPSCLGKNFYHCYFDKKIYKIKE